MNIRVAQLHKEEDAATIHCIQQIIRENNPFVFLDIREDEDSIKKWIRSQSHSNYWLYTNPFNTFTYGIYLKDKIIGIATIKRKLSPALYADSGNIGLCLEACFRGTGYGKASLLALIEEARTFHHLEDILLCCEYDNVISRNLCKSIGGVLTHEDSFVHYWITAHEENLMVEP